MKKNSNRFKSYDYFSQYANSLKYEKLDVTINSFQSHNTIFCDVTRGNRISDLIRPNNVYWGQVEFKYKIEIEIPYILLHFFDNDSHSIDVHIDENNFSCI